MTYLVHLFKYIQVAKGDLIDHLPHQEVLKHLQVKCLRVNLTKSTLISDTIHNLGHQLNFHGCISSTKKGHENASHRISEIYVNYIDFLSEIIVPLCGKEQAQKQTFTVFENKK